MNSEKLYLKLNFSPDNEALFSSYTNWPTDLKKNTVTYQFMLIVPK